MVPVAGSPTTWFIGHVAQKGPLSAQDLRSTPASRMKAPLRVPIRTSTRFDTAISSLPCAGRLDPALHCRVLVARADVTRKANNVNRGNDVSCQRESNHDQTLSPATVH